MAAESQTQTDAQIETGVEEPRQVDADHDVEAFADDGTHAMVWCVTRVDDTTVAVERQACEDGLRQQIGTASVGDGRPTFSIDVDKTTEQWARECAEADPELALEEVREHYSDD